MNSNTELTGRPLLLTVKAAAAHLGVSASMVRTLLDRGQLTKIKLTESVKGQCYVRLAEIEALASGAVAAAEPEPLRNFRAAFSAKLSGEGGE